MLVEEFYKNYVEHDEEPLNTQLSKLQPKKDTQSVPSREIENLGSIGTPTVLSVTIFYGRRSVKLLSLIFLNCLVT